MLVNNVQKNMLWYVTLSLLISNVFGLLSSVFAELALVRCDMPGGVPPDGLTLYTILTFITTTIAFIC
jgi:hypothetical protein